MKDFFRPPKRILDEYLAEQFMAEFDKEFNKKIEEMKEEESSKLLNEYIIKFEKNMIKHYKYEPYLVKCLINEFRKTHSKRLEFKNIKKEYLKRKNQE